MFFPGCLLHKYVQPLVLLLNMYALGILLDTTQTGSYSCIKLMPRHVLHDRALGSINRIALKCLKSIQGIRSYVTTIKKCIDVFYYKNHRCILQMKMHQKEHS